MKDMLQMKIVQKSPEIWGFHLRFFRDRWKSSRFMLPHPPTKGFKGKINYELSWDLQMSLHRFWVHPLNYLVENFNFFPSRGNPAKNTQSKNSLEIEVKNSKSLKCFGRRWKVIFNFIPPSIAGKFPWCRLGVKNYTLFYDITLRVLFLLRGFSLVSLSSNLKNLFLQPGNIVPLKFLLYLCFSPPQFSEL